MRRVSSVAEGVSATDSALRAPSVAACVMLAIDLPDAAILGASAGAPSSLQFALRHRDRCNALVLVVPAAFVPRRGGAAPLTIPADAIYIDTTAIPVEEVVQQVLAIVEERLAGQRR